MIRNSSREGTVVLVLNDNGVCMDYPIVWDDTTRMWSFVGQTFNRLDSVLDFLSTSPLQSKAGGYDVVLTQPAPGGKAFDVERELLGVEMPPVDKETSQRIVSLRQQSAKRKASLVTSSMSTATPPPTTHNDNADEEDGYEAMHRNPNNPNNNNNNKAAPRKDVDPSSHSSQTSDACVDDDESYQLPSRDSVNSVVLNDIDASAEDESYQLPKRDSRDSVLLNDMAFHTGGGNNTNDNENVEVDESFEYEETNRSRANKGNTSTTLPSGNAAVTKATPPRKHVDAASFVVTVDAKRRESLGFSLKEEQHQGQTRLTVSKVVPGGAASRDGRLRVGQHVLEINGAAIKDLGPRKTVREAAAIMKKRDLDIALTLTIAGPAPAVREPDGADHATTAQHATPPDAVDTFDGFDTNKADGNSGQDAAPPALPAKRGGGNVTPVSQQRVTSFVENPNLAIDTSAVTDVNLVNRETDTDGHDDDDDLRPDVTECYASTMPKNQVSKVVVAAGPGAFLVRPSSKDNQVVLVCNDNGHAVPYPLRYIDGEWSFGTIKSGTLKRLLQNLQVEQIAGRKGPNFSLKAPAPGGEPFSFAEWHQSQSSTSASPSTALAI
eukprot:m.89536 g.89536  ORF g.89536 m.89536 type:complete len:607 (-) comp9806_c3_seq1:223-2043(-)